MYLDCWRCEETPGKELEKYDYSGMDDAGLTITLREENEMTRDHISNFEDLIKLGPTSTKSQSGDFNLFDLLEVVNISFNFFSVLSFLRLSIAQSCLGRLV